MQHTVTVNIPETLEPRFKTIDDVDMFVSIITIEALQQRTTLPTDRQMEEAAQLMFNEYATDKELTEFSVLDGEPVYE
jgi:hypothetical protein